MELGANVFNTSAERFYWFSHFLWWILVPVIFLVLRSKSVILPLLVLFGVVFVFEIHHLIKAVLAQSYYPGMVTAVFYPIVGIFFYKELVREWKN